MTARSCGNISIHLVFYDMLSETVRLLVGLLECNGLGTAALLA
jgi:hypothetical protein